MAIVKSFEITERHILQMDSSDLLRLMRTSDRLQFNVPDDAHVRIDQDDGKVWVTWEMVRQSKGDN